MWLFLSWRVTADTPTAVWWFCFRIRKLHLLPVVLMPCQVFKQLASWDGPSDNVPLFQAALEAVWSPQEIHVTGPSTHLWFSSGGSLPECIFGDMFAGRLTRVTFQQAWWPLELGFPEVLEVSQGPLEYYCSFLHRCCVLLGLCVMIMNPFEFWHSETLRHPSDPLSS